MSLYIDSDVLKVQVSQLEGLKQSYSNNHDYWAANRYEIWNWAAGSYLTMGSKQLYDGYQKSKRNQKKLFEELCIKLIKPTKPCIVELSNVTTLSIIIDDHTFGDVLDLQFDDERLVCPWIDVPINKVQFDVFDNVKVMHEDINNLNSHLEYIKETFKQLIGTSLLLDSFIM